MAPIRIALLCLVFSALGFFLGQQTSRPAMPSAAPVSTEDIQTRVYESLSLPDPDRRTRAFGDLLAVLEPAQAEALDTALWSASVDMDEASAILLADWWARFDPKGARKRCAKWWPPDARVCWFAVHRRWAQQDLEAARLAVEGLGERNVGREREALVLGWLESGNTQGLWEYVAALPRGMGRQKVLLTLTRRMAIRDGAQATLRFAESYSDADPDFKNQLFVRAAAAASMHDPKRAADWASQHYGGPFGRRLLGHLATTWVYQDGEAALRWLLSIAPGPDREVAIRSAYGLWLSRERDAAMGFIASLGPGSAPQAAIPSYAIALARHDPVEALPWLAAVEDAKDARNATVSIGKLWFAQDPAGAASWLDEAEIAAELAEEIVAPPKPRPKPRTRARDRRAVDRKARLGENQSAAREPPAS